MDQLITKFSTPIRRFISRGLSLPTLSTFSRSSSFNSGGDQTPLPSAGKRQREESDEDGDQQDGPAKRVKMDIDEEPTPAPSEPASAVREESATVETIRPGVEALSIAPSTPPSANGRTRSAQSSPDSKRTKYQRGLRGTRKSGGGATTTTADSPSPSKPRLGPKRQCALLVSFCGSGYSGMQIQKDAKTIEGTIFNALVKVGSVSEDNSDDPAKVNIQRAARTDAGVHASRNIVSVKAIVELPGVTDLVGVLNKHLPEEIHIWDIVRTQNSFNARTSCDSRKYTYFMPTYMLLPPAPASLTANAHRDVDEGAYDVAKHPFWKSVANQPITPESTLFMLRKKWRIDEETLSRFKSVLQEYVGTHNFWNFTIGREFKEAAAHRHMKSIEVSDPAIYGDTEWVSVQIHGQSFMLHQRKMIAAAAFVTRSQGSPSLVPQLYESTRARIPKAPALGLLLEEPVYESYNQKIEVANAKWKDAAASGSKAQEEDSEHQANFIRDPINFEKYQKAIEEFKKNHIYAEMQRVEEEQGTFDAWLSSVDLAEARLFYDLRRLPVPSELNIQVKAGSTTRSSVAKDDGDESDDALGKGKINFKSVDLEG